MRKFFVVIIIIALNSLYFSCKNVDRNITVTKNFTTTANLEKLQEQFLLGSHLCREPMPPVDELKKDMQILKQKGFNLIKLQEHWAIDEPEEGLYNFSKYEELIAFAKKMPPRRKDTKNHEVNILKSQPYHVNSLINTYENYSCLLLPDCIYFNWL